MSEKQASEERDLDLNEEKDTRMEYSRGGYWSDVSEYGEDKSKIHDLRCDV